MSPGPLPAAPARPACYRAHLRVGSTSLSNVTARVLFSLAAGAARRPRLVLAIAITLGLAGGALALRLHPTAATDTFVSSSSPEYKATQRFYRDFGEEPVEVLVKGSLQQLVLSSDIVRLAGLEGCLSGNVPASALAQEGGRNGPCGQLARAHTVKVVFGPGTFVTEAAEQLDEQLTAADQAGGRSRPSRPNGWSPRRRSRAACPPAKRKRSARRRARSRWRASRSTWPRSRFSTASRRGRASKIPTSSRRSCSIRASPRARRRRASPTCSRVPTRRWSRCA